MARLLFLFLLFNITFACESYIEINGFKLGCPLEIDDSIKPFHPKMVASTYQTENVKFFDRALITTDHQKNIVTLRFFKEYAFTKENQADILKQAGKDLVIMMKTFEKQWGKFNVTPGLKAFLEMPETPVALEYFSRQRAINKKPLSKKIESVIFTIINHPKINDDSKAPNKITFDLIVNGKRK